MAKSNTGAGLEERVFGELTSSQRVVDVTTNARLDWPSLTTTSGEVTIRHVLLHDLERSLSRTTTPSRYLIERQHSQKPIIPTCLRLLFHQRVAAESALRAMSRRAKIR